MRSAYLDCSLSGVCHLLKMFAQLVSSTLNKSIDGDYVKAGASISNSWNGEKVVRFEGRIRLARLRTHRVCRICGRVVAKLESGDFKCPEDGVLDYRHIKRENYLYGTIDAFDRDWITTFGSNAIRNLLDPTGASWRSLLDRLKGLQGEAWLNQWKAIVQKVDAAIDSFYVQAKRAEIFNAILYTSGALEVRSISRARSKLPPTATGQGIVHGTRFTAAGEKPFYEVTRGALSDYGESREMWVETLVVHYKKKIGKDELDIGIRAPLKIYGHAYRIWLRINGVHFYPVTPYTESSSGETAWVYRIYHTPGWKDNLKRLLIHLRELETRAVGIVDAAGKRRAQDARAELAKVGVPSDEIDEILQDWRGGSLWDLVTVMPDRQYGVALLVKHGLLDDPDK